MFLCELAVVDFLDLKSMRLICVWGSLGKQADPHPQCNEEVSHEVESTAQILSNNLHLSVSDGCECFLMFGACRFMLALLMSEAAYGIS